MTRCSDGSRGGRSKSSSTESHLPIDADGRFRESKNGSSEYGTETLRFEGTVHPDRIIGTFKYEEWEGMTCRTGTRGDPEIHFVARRRG